MNSLKCTKCLFVKNKVYKLIFVVTPSISFSAFTKLLLLLYLPSVYRCSWKTMPAVKAGIDGMAHKWIANARYRDGGSG